MNIAESISLALDAVRAHKLRSGLTLLSVGIGVFAIIASSGITGTLANALSTQLADLGEHSLLIQRTPSMSFGTNWRKYMRRKPITPELAEEFRQRMTLTNLVSVSNTAPGMTVKHGDQSTNPNVSLIGIDHMYFSVNAASIESGRAFVEQDLVVNARNAIIGADVVNTLFPSGNPLGQTITIKNQQFTVVGVLTKRGGVLGQSQDNRVLIPLSVFVTYYTWRWDTSVDIAVKATSRGALEATADEAIGHMRMLRGVPPGKENDFELDTNEALTAQFGSLASAIGVVAWISGLGALLAAGIGIMNMMLVSVKERTREIGVRKALGARKQWIVRQFLIEALTLCQLGGLTGVIGGLSITWILGQVVQSNTMPSLVIAWPWGAVVFSVIACTAIGIGFGLYPAWQAARLDPIEALRYE
ncbi:MAG: ABC transporter permease [Bradyrhizobiaceae bacterium]|nr:ABC transporter permease [Bradyrhizobiaceae bacterium]